MDELKGLIRDLDADVVNLRTEAKNREAAGSKRDRRRDILLRLLIVAVLAVGVFVWRFVAYSTCTTSRQHALTGPGNERVSLFLGAFTASVTVRHLTPKQRAADLTVLREARNGRYPLIPSEATLKAAGDAAIAGDAQAVRALDKNTEYQKLSASHPVCSLWGT